MSTAMHTWACSSVGQAGALPYTDAAFVSHIKKGIVQTSVNLLLCNRRQYPYVTRP